MSSQQYKYERIPMNYDTCDNTCNSDTKKECDIVVYVHSSRSNIFHTTKGHHSAKKPVFVKDLGASMKICAICEMDFI